MYRLEFSGDRIVFYRDEKLRAVYSPQILNAKNELLPDVLDTLLKDVPADIHLTGDFDGWDMSMVARCVSHKVRVFSIDIDCRGVL